MDLGLVTWDHWCDTFQPDPRFKLEKSALEYVGPIPEGFSPISGGAITITGRVAEVDVEAFKSGSDMAWLRGLSMRFFYDYTPDPIIINYKTLWALALGVNAADQTETYVLVLEERDRRLGGLPGYIRAGLGFVSLTTEDRHSKFWSMFREMTVDIY